MVKFLVPALPPIGPQIREAVAEAVHGTLEAFIASAKTQRTQAESCRSCGTTSVSQYIDDPDGLPSLTGTYCDECYKRTLHEAKDARQRALSRPTCRRCGGTGELQETKDETGPLNGIFCRHCIQFIVTLENWARTNEKAAAYLQATRESMALCAFKGSSAAIKKLHDEFRMKARR